MLRMIPVRLIVISIEDFFGLALKEGNVNDDSISTFLLYTLVDWWPSTLQFRSITPDKASYQIRKHCCVVPFLSVTSYFIPRSSSSST